jgi:hypothetical protein
MFKKSAIILVLLMFIFSAVPAYAANCNQAPDYNHIVNCNQAIYYNYASNCSLFDFQKPVIYKSDLIVTKAGGVYQVGFTTISFPKGFINANRLPIVIHVEVSSVGGVPGIEFNPDIPSFNKDVTIHVDCYNGVLYDKTLRKNIKQHIGQQNLKVSHFSRYAFS